MSVDRRPPQNAVECPRCGERYPDSERFCASCGMPLVLVGDEHVARSEAHVRARKIRPELTRGSLVRVVTAQNQVEAELVQNILLEEGVPSVARRAAAFDVPDFLAAGPRDVLVPESGVETARAVLSASDFERALARPPAAQARAHIARLAGALVGGTALAALIAWALIHAAH